MTPQQMALSRLARLALNSVSESPPSVRAETCRLVAMALHDACPDMADLAKRAAAQFEAAQESEDLLKELLNS